jgi:ubiquinone/menaquinone biosynthesis C-methylase UbiE
MTERTAQHASDAVHDNLAESYGYSVDATLAAQLKYRLVLEHAPRNARILDVGCANGLHTRKVAPHCREIVAIDLNRRMLALAGEALAGDGVDNAHLLEMNATKLSFEGSSFDAAFCFSTLLLIPEAERVVAEIARVLRPGGIAVLDITGRRNLSQRHWDRWWRTQGHPGLRSFTWPQAKALLGANQLEIVTAPALGFLDQWKYLPVLRRAAFLERVLHPSLDRDLDFAVSNLRPLRPLANRWYVVCRRMAVQ